MLCIGFGCKKESTWSEREAVAAKKQHALQTSIWQMARASHSHPQDACSQDWNRNHDYVRLRNVVFPSHQGLKGLRAALCARSSFSQMTFPKRCALSCRQAPTAKLCARPIDSPSTRLNILTALILLIFKSFRAWPAFSHQKSPDHERLLQ